MLVRAAVAAPARPPHAPSLSQILPHHDATVQFLARLRAAATPFVLGKSPAAVAAPAPSPPHASPLPPSLLLLMLRAFLLPLFLLVLLRAFLFFTSTLIRPHHDAKVGWSLNLMKLGQPRGRVEDS